MVLVINLQDDTVTVGAFHLVCSGGMGDSVDGLLVVAGHVEGECVFLVASSAAARCLYIYVNSHSLADACDCGISELGGRVCMTHKL